MSQNMRRIYVTRKDSTHNVAQIIKWKILHYLPTEENVIKPRYSTNSMAPEHQRCNFVP